MSAFFECPRCGKKSWNKNDVANGYCGKCHDFTGTNRQVEDPFSRLGETPGLRVHAEPIDASRARQLTGIYTQSTAVHSRSRGWMPRVAVTISHTPLVGRGAEQEVQLMLASDDVALLIDHLQEGLAAALRDAATGPIEGEDPR